MGCKKWLKLLIEGAVCVIEYYYNNSNINKVRWMGTNLSQQQGSLSESIQQSYTLHQNELLMDHKTKKACTLHRVETKSQQQTSLVHHNIELYRKINCNSISKLIQYHELDNSGYCSDSSKFYLVFQGYSTPNVKQEYFYRRYAGLGFEFQEIQAMLSAMLCGLRHYSLSFGRKQSHLSLQSLTICPTTKLLQLRDPWLLEQKKANPAQTPINFLALYPSPEKILASNQPNIDYDQYKSDLFSIGIFGLQFISMNFRDDLYVQRKFVDRGRLTSSLAAVGGNGRLRGGLGILLSQDPNQRFNIYQYWDIRCEKQYRLNKANIEPQVTPPLTTSRIEKPLINPQPSIYNILQQSQAHRQNLNPYNYPNMPNIQLVKQINPMSQSNININNEWRPQVSNVTQSTPMKTSHVQTVPIVPALVRQFSKPLEIKNGRGQMEGKTINSFRKKPNVHFQQPNNSPFRQQNSNSIQYLRQPNKSPYQNQSPTSANSNTNSSNIINVNPSTSYNNSIGYIKSLANQGSMGNGVGVNMTSSIGQPNTSASVYKSFQTPRFNYQSPTTEVKNSTPSIGHMNSSIQNVNNSMQNMTNSIKGQNMTGSATANLTSSFNAYNAYQKNMYQSYNQYNNNQFGINALNGVNIANNNNNYLQNSPGQSSSNSPILTKSIISSEPAPGLVPNFVKNLSEDNTLPYSNAQSLRETKANMEVDPNSFSPNNGGYSTLPLSNIQTSIAKEQNKSPIRPQKSPSPIKIPNASNMNSPTIYPQNLEKAPSQQQSTQLQPLDTQTQMPAQPINPSSSSSTSPNPLQSTPPPPPRYPNKYNSTIVQVNQETPNQSQESQDQIANDIEFIVEEYDTGSRYEGYKKKGLRHGRGKFYYQDGGYYDGEWKKNQMHGWGKLYYEGGQLAYEGEWAHDQFHGYGKVYNDNPVVLDGGFDYTNFDLLDDYWEFYEGMLANDTKQGRGRIQLTNKQLFQGDFHTDRIQGFGKFLRRDGNVVQGIWRDSRLIKVLTSNDIYK